MKKNIVSTFSAALILSTALVGCGANHSGALGNRNGVRPIGYFNGQNNNPRNNNPRYTNDRLGYNNPTNNNGNHNLGMGGNGRMHNAGNQQAKGLGHNARKHKIQARTIAHRVASLKNVENVSVVVTNHDVLVGVKTHDKTTRNLKSGIRKTVQGVVNNKTIHVATKPKMYHRIQNVSNNLHDGGTLNEMSSDIRGIINDLGNAAKRPFQNNVH